MGIRTGTRLRSIVRLKRTTALCSSLVSMAVFFGGPTAIAAEEPAGLLPKPSAKPSPDDSARGLRFSDDGNVVSQADATAFDAIRLDPWQPYAEGSIGSLSGGQTFGNAGFFFPTYQTVDSLAFLNLRGDFSQKGSRQGSVGLGYRRAIPGGLFGSDAVVGVNAYVDLLDYESDNTYWQGSLGLELLSRNFELLGNYYKSEDDPLQLGQQVFNGAGLNGTSVVAQSGTITQFQNAFSGWDIEAAYKVDLTNQANLRVHGGYYDFKRAQTTFKGPRAGLELAFDDPFGIVGGQFSFGGEMRDDDQDGREYAGFLRLRIPLGQARQSGRLAKDASDLDRLMTGRVRRQDRILVDVQTEDQLVETPIFDATSGQAINAYFISETSIGTGDCSAGLQACTISQVTADPDFGAGDILIPIDAAGAITSVLTLTGNYQQVVGAGSGGALSATLSDGSNSVLNLSGLGNRANVAGVDIGSFDNTRVAGIATDGATGITGNGFGGSVDIDDVQTTNGGVTLAGADAAVVNVTNSTLGGGTGAALTANSATPGGLQINVSDTMLSTTGTGAALNISGSDSGDVIVTGFADNTVTGTGGFSFDNVTFDADGNPGNGSSQVAGGTLNVGSGGAVNGVGVNLNDVLGDLAFDTLNISNDGGTGLFVRDDAGKGGTFSLGASGGTINTTNGTATDIDPVVLNVTLDMLNASGGVNGVLLDTVTGTFNVLAGSITGTSGAAFVLTNSDIDVNFAASIANAAGNSVQIDTQSGGTVEFSGAITDTGDGVSLVNNGGSTVIFSGGLDIDTTTSTAFSATGAGTVNVTGGSNSISSSAGTALSLSNVTVDQTFASVTSGGGVNGVSIDGTFGTLTVTGDTMITGATGDGISIINSGAAVALNGTTTVTAAGGDGVSISGASGAITFGSLGVTTPGEHGVSLANNTGIFNFGQTDITLGATAGSRGIDFAGANLTAYFGATTISGVGLGADQVGIDLNGATLSSSVNFVSAAISGPASATDSIGIDLTGVAGNQSVRIGEAVAGGASSSIADLHRGVVIDPTASVQFLFGDGESVTDRGSSIDVNGLAGSYLIDAGSGTSVSSFFDFDDVAFGAADEFNFPTAANSTVFVSQAGGRVQAGVNGLNVALNTITVAEAEALADTDQTFVFVGDAGGDLSLSGGGLDGFTLKDSQNIDGFADGNSISTGLLLPINISGDFSSISDMVTANTVTVSNTTAGATGLVTLASTGGSTIQNFDLDANGFGVGDAAISLSLNTAASTLRNLNITNLGDGADGVNLTGSDATLSDVTISGPGGTTGRGVNIEDGGRDIRVDLSSLTINNAGEVGLRVNGAGTGSVILHGSLNVTNLDGQAIDIDTASVTITSGSASSTNSTGAGIRFANIANGSSATFDGATSVTGSAGAGIQIENSMFSATFNGPTVLNNAATGGAGIALTNNAGSNLHFAGVDIDTSTGTGFSATGGGTVSIAADSIRTTAGQALELNGVTLGSSQSQITELVSTGSTGAGVSITNVDQAPPPVRTSGGLRVNAGGTTVTNAATNGIEISNSSANFVFGGTTTVSGSAAGDNVHLNGANGTVQFDNLISNAAFEDGIEIQGATQNVTIAAGAFGAVTANDYNVFVENQVSGTVTLTNVALNSVVTDNVTLFDNAGTIIFNGGTVTQSGTNGSAAVDIEGGTAAITIGSDIVHSASGPFAAGVLVDGTAGGVINFSGDITNTGDGPTIAIGFNAAIAGTDIAFTNSTISDTGGLGIGIFGLDNASSVVFAPSTSYTSLNSGTTPLYLEGNEGDITFGGPVTITNSGGVGIEMIGNFGTVNFNGLVTVANPFALGVSALSNFGGTINFTGGLDIDSVDAFAGFGAAGGGTFNLTGTNNNIDVTGAGFYALVLNDVTIGTGGFDLNRVKASGTGVDALFEDGIALIDVTGGTGTFGTVQIDGADGVNSDGIEIDGGNANFSFGTVTISDVFDEGIEIENGYSGTATFNGPVTITRASTNGIGIEGTSGQISFNNTVSIISPTEVGVELDGTITGAITFADLDIQLQSAGSTGLDASDAILNTTFTADDFDVTTTFALAQTRGVDLSGTTGTGQILLGDAAVGTANGASIGADVAIGVQLSDTSAISFVFGDGELTTDRASTINAVTQISAPAGTAGGSYNFNDVGNLDAGRIVLPFSADGFVYVGAAASGDGSGSDLDNLANAATADAITASGTTFVLVNTGTVAAPNIITSNSGFTLSNGQNIDGFGNGNSITTGGFDLTNFIGLPGGSQVLTHVGGAATLVSATLSETLTVSGNNQIENVVLSNTTGESVVSTSGFSAGETLTLGGADGALQILEGTGNIGNGIDLSFANGTVNIVDVEIDGADVGLFLQQNTTLGLDVDRLVIRSDASSFAGISVNDGVTATLDLATNAGDVLQISGGQRGIQLQDFVGIITFGNNSANTTITGGSTASVQIANNSSGTANFNMAITQNNAAHAVELFRGGGTPSGTFSFNNLITANTGAATAINLDGNFGNATFNFAGGLDIDTTTGTGLVMNAGGTISGGGVSSSIRSGSGRPLVLNDVTIGTSGLTFGSLTTTAATLPSTAVPIAFENVSGGAFNGGDVTLFGQHFINGSNGLRIGNSSNDFTFDSFTIDGPFDYAADLLNTSGTVTFTTIDIDGNGARGINIDGNSGTININGGSIGASNNSFGQGGLRIANQTVSGQVNTTGLTVSSSISDAVSIINSAGSVTMTGGSITNTSTNDALDISGGSATINIGSNIVQSGSGGSNAAVEIDGTSGNITLSGNITSTSTVGDILIGQSSAITGGTIAFTGSTINLSGGTTGADNGVNISSVGAGASVTFGAGTAITLDGGHNGFDIGGNNGAIQVNGTVTITNPFAEGISIFANPGSVEFNSPVSITGAAASGTGLGEGLQIDFGAGNVTFGSTLNISNVAGRQSHAIGLGSSFALFTGQATFNGQVTINNSLAGGEGVAVGSGTALFAGGLDVTTSTGVAVRQTGGSLTIQNSGIEQITTTGALALRVNGSGQTFVGSFDSITAVNSPFVAAGRGIQLSNLTAGSSLTVLGATTLTGYSQHGIFVENSDASLNFQGLTTINAGTTAGAGVTLTNTGATSVTFSGGLDIDTTTGTGFSANSGTINVLNGAATNTITVGDAVALDLSSATINATFSNITSNNTGKDSIRLTNLDCTFTLNGGTLTTLVDGTDFNSVEIRQNDLTATRALTTNFNNLTVKHNAPTTAGGNEDGISGATFGDDTLTIAIDNSSFQTEDSSVRLLAETADGVVLTSFLNNTLLGDVTAFDPPVFNNGVTFVGVTFDANPTTALLESVDVGSLAIGTDAVKTNHGLNLTRGTVVDGTFILTNSNLGSLVINDYQADTFVNGLVVTDQSGAQLTINGGSIDAGGVALTDTDVTIILSALDLSSNSASAALQADRLAGSFTVSGAANIAGPAEEYFITLPAFILERSALSVQNSTANFRFGSLNTSSVTPIVQSGLVVTNGGVSHGILLRSNSGSFTVVGATTIGQTARDAISVTSQTGDLSFGAVTLTNPGSPVNGAAAGTPGSGISFAGNGGTYTFGATTITGAATSGIVFNGLTGGTVTFNDTTTITNPGGSGVQLTGTNTAGITFNDLDVGLGTVSTTGLNANAGVVNTTFTATDFDVTATGTLAGTRGIDLRGTTTAIMGQILLGEATIGTANGASIGTGVAIGVDLSSTTAVNLTFGDGELTTDRASTISAATQINAPSGTAGGSYNFNDVGNFSTSSLNLPVLAGGLGDLVFVSDAATGAGDGSTPTDATTIAAADAISATNTSFVLVNNGNRIVSTGFTLGTSQNITGFGNGVTSVSSSGFDLTNFMGVPGAGQTFNHAGGAATLTSTGSSTIATAGNNLIENVIISNSTGSTAIDVSTASGGSTVTLGGSDGPLRITEGAGGIGTGIRAVSASATLNIVDVEINGATTGLLLENTSNLTLDVDRLVIVSDASSTAGLSVGGTGGTLDIATEASDTIHISDGQLGVLFNGFAGALTLGNGTANATISSGMGTSVAISGGSGSATFNTAISQNNNTRAIDLTAASTGTFIFNSLITANTGAGTAIDLSGNTGGATFNFTGGLDIDTISGTGFLATGGGTVSVTGAANTINSTAGTALDLDGVTIGGSGITFATITSNNSTGDGISLNNVNGGALNVTGTTTISNPGAHGIDISGSNSATFNFAAVDIDSASASNGMDINGFSTTSITGQLTIDMVGSGSGLNVINTGGGSFTALNASNTINVVSGEAINISGATVNATFASATATGFFGRGIDINNHSGTLTINGGTLTSLGANDAIEITGGSGTLTIGTDVDSTNATGNAVEIIGRTGGSIDISGNLIDGSATTGGRISVFNNTSGTTTFSGTSKVVNAGFGTVVTLQNNTGHTVNFTNGGLDIDITTGSTGFFASGSGTINVTGPNNSITATTGIALSASDVSIGTNGITFRSISANGGGSPAITLDTVGGSGTFSVTGDGTTATQGGNGSGGLIQNRNSDGIVLNAVSNVSLANLTVSGSGTHGIEVDNVTNLDLTEVTLSNNGNALGENGFDAQNLLGNSNTIANSIITGSADHNMHVVNTTGTGAVLTITNSQINSNNVTFGDDGIYFGTLGSATAQLAVNATTFTGNRSDGIQVDAAGNSMATLILTNSRIENGNVAVNLTGSQAGQLNFTVDDNVFNTFTNNVINVVHNGTSGGFSGNIRRNTVNTSTFGSGITVIAEGASIGSGPSGVVLIDDNTITNFNVFGIQATAREGTASLHATITNNKINTPGAFAEDGIRVESGNGSAGESNFVCLDVTGNAVTTLSFDEGVQIEQYAGNTFQLEGFVGDGTNSNTVEDYLDLVNTLVQPSNVRTSGRIVNYTMATACTLP